MAQGFQLAHPMWEDIHNWHLFNYNLSRLLIDLIADYGMIQLLPSGTPTLQSTSTGNWTRPDNVFGTEGTIDAMISCTTEPAKQGPKTDHLPILIALELEVPRMDDTPHLNWCEVDWEHFKEMNFKKWRNMSCMPSSPRLKHVFRILNLALTPSDGGHVHTLSDQQYKTLKNQYADEIAATKKQHWIDWLEDLEGNDLWTVNRYVSSEPTDSSKSRIPTLTAKKPDGSTVEATTNDEKSNLIAEAFFPHPPITNSIPDDFIYPDLVAPHMPITQDQIARAIPKLSGYKAPGPDGIATSSSNNAAPY
ncbi:hypothetical protein BDR03DRAFT_1016708 [Suillus americanus]|nr:hypothetical protein BDR03DRAFT_1016708 [Suillus americanus]